MIIASTYEIKQQIGSGGAGTVFLAEHLRLGKLVVLKADKRKITVGADMLRREVDILKDLSHPRIPRVYDFFSEGENIYTVMDYIEGESLDKPLARGERFSQAQVILWGEQLLDALCYLHSPTHGVPPKGFVHSDIKPANLMRMPDNGICLIDFNVALALGEENAVGRSAGYASPEHYGLDFSTEVDTEPMGQITVVMEEEEGTELMDTFGDGFSDSDAGQSSNNAYRQRAAILPDVRSDIYSVGATLYHLLSGKKPSWNAKKVTPLSGAEYSESFVKIITKAMNPNPDLRYQTAEAMYQELVHLRENDPRVKRMRRSNMLAGVLCLFLLMVGSGLTFVGLKRMQIEERWLKLAEYSKNALEQGDVSAALRYALDALPEGKNILEPSCRPQVRRALANALGVYDLSDGFRRQASVTLPSAPFFISMAPDGSTAACMYAYELAIIDMDSAEIRNCLPAEPSALAEVKYLDADRIVFAGKDGLTVYSIGERRILWTGQAATAVCVSADGSCVAAVYKDAGEAVVYHTADGTVIRTVDFEGRYQAVAVNDSFANPQDNLLALSHDGSYLAVSFADGALTVYNLEHEAEDLLIYDETSGFSHFEGGFSGKYFAFSAAGGEMTPVFAVVDVEEAIQTGGFENSSSFGVQADETGIFLQTDNILVKIDPITGEQVPLVRTLERIQRFARGKSNTLITTNGGIFFYDSYASQISAFQKEYGSEFLQLAEGKAIIGSRDTPVLSVINYVAHPEGEILSYDSSYVHDEARLSSDGTRVMLFRYDQFRIYDIDGRLISEVEIPDAEEVYDQQYKREDMQSFLEVIYNDGRVLVYDGTDGHLQEERKEEQLDQSLHEVFYTDRLRIESPLHGTPVIYDKKSGEKIAKLEEDTYLTYVTQVGEGILVQYVTAEGETYGQLLDHTCSVIADLPYLSDVIGDELIFDYPTGKLRKTHIHSIEELVEMARRKLN